EQLEEKKQELEEEKESEKELDVKELDMRKRCEKSLSTGLVLNKEAGRRDRRADRESVVVLDADLVSKGGKRKAAVAAEQACNELVGE
ncbi:hypothetical protein BpHYR1_023701, partial [Brachionus plicatilis]